MYISGTLPTTFCVFSALRMPVSTLPFQILALPLPPEIKLLLLLLNRLSFTSSFEGSTVENQE